MWIKFDLCIVNMDNITNIYIRNNDTKLSKIEPEFAYQVMCGIDKGTSFTIFKSNSIKECEEYIEKINKILDTKKLEI